MVHLWLKLSLEDNTISVIFQSDFQPYFQASVCGAAFSYGTFLLRVSQVKSFTASVFTDTAFCVLILVLILKTISNSKPQISNLFKNSFSSVPMRVYYNFKYFRLN